MTNNRKQYSQQFKIDAVKLVTEEGYKVSETARRLGIHGGILRRWKKQLIAEGTHAFPGNGKMSSSGSARKTNN
ncbi:MAG: transposase [Candidatus Poribacteria bacterium]|jgi:transposase|nr:transposase [Candidatus Poribacteria bacterium]